MTDWKEITDPEELFRLKREGWEIEKIYDNEWLKWDSVSWSASWTFRARPAQPKMKKVKMLCYFFNNKYLAWYVEGRILQTSDWIRIPAEDKEIEVQDDM